MKKHSIFQVTGLPRSGSAWLSAALNYAPDVICVHEPVDRRVPEPKGEYRGVGEAGSHLLVPEYREREADLRVFIHRDAGECHEALSRAMGEEVPVDWFNDGLLPLGRDYLQQADIVLDYNDLFCFANVRKVWEKVSAHKFDADKVAMLLGMNVQRNSLEYDFEPAFMDAVVKHQERRVA